MRITISLSNSDLTHFRCMVQDRLQRTAARADDDIIGSAMALVENIQTQTLSDFVAQRITKLNVMVSMLNDKEWQIPQLERTRVLTALSYFSDPHDLIPDAIPVLGLLDDAIIIELMVRELKHEIDAFEDFCDYRKRQANALSSHTKTTLCPTSDTPTHVAGKRQSLHQRMRNRHCREHRGNGSQLGLF